MPPPALPSVWRYAARCDIPTNADVFTWSLGNGVFSLELQPTDSNQPQYPCRGFFAVSRGVARFTRTVNQPYGDCVPPNWSAVWAFTEGHLTWSKLRGFPSVYDDFAPFFAETPWQRMG